MSATGSGAGSGAVLGIVLVLLGQQFAVLNLSSLVPGIEDILVGAVIGGLVGAGIGYALGRRYASKHPAPASTSAGGTGTTPPQ
jgi:hypothetical protein